MWYLRERQGYAVCCLSSISLGFCPVLATPSRQMAILPVYQISLYSWNEDSGGAPCTSRTSMWCSSFLSAVKRGVSGSRGRGNSTGTVAEDDPRRHDLRPRTCSRTGSGRLLTMEVCPQLLAARIGLRI